MGLRINTNIAALNAARILNRSTGELRTSMERLASGLRINRAKDDAAGLSVSEGLRTVVRGSVVAQRNVQDGISMMQTAEGALETTTQILQRMRELAMQASNGTYVDTGTARTAMQAEIDALIAQIDDIANDTEFNGVQLLDGTSGTITFQSGVRNGQIITVAGQDTLSGSLGTTDTVDNTNLTTQSNASDALVFLEEAIDQISGIRGTFGAIQNRLEFTMSTLAIQEENSAASESAIRDADMAKETMEFTRGQILLNAGTMVLAQSNIVPQTALQLLG
jgi:flagellin